MEDRDLDVMGQGDLIAVALGRTRHLGRGLDELRGEPEGENGRQGIANEGYSIEDRLYRLTFGDGRGDGLYQGFGPRFEESRANLQREADKDRGIVILHFGH